MVWKQPVLQWKVLILELQLQEVVKQIKGAMVPAVDVETELDEMPERVFRLIRNARNYSYTVVDDQVYYRVNSLMNQGENACRHCRTL